MTYLRPPSSRQQLDYQQKDNAFIRHADERNPSGKKNDGDA